MEGSDSEYSNKPKDRLLSLLDQVEMRVEQLRKDAVRLEDEKDAMLTTLDTLRNNEMLIALEQGLFSFFRYCVTINRTSNFRFLSHFQTK